MLHPRARLAAVLLAAAAILPACALQQDHKRMARAFLTAKTADLAMAPAAPDFTFYMNSRDDPPVTRNDYREIAQWNGSLNAHIDVNRLTSRGTTAIAHVHETTDISRLLGHPGWDATMTFWFDDAHHGGLISQALYVPEPTNPDWRPYLEPALPYLKEHHADTLAAIYPDDQLVMTPAAGRAWKRILTDWRLSLADEPATN